MFLKAISTVLLLTVVRQGEVGAFSINKSGRSADHHHHTYSDEPVPTREDFATKTTVTANNDIQRRDLLERVVTVFSASALGLAVTTPQSPAWADVSDGNALPQGAAQFGRVVRAKTDLLGVQKRVEEGASEMDKAEWNNVGAFLRRVYGVSEDMKAIAGGFDAAKKQRAAELIENLKKFSKAADAPTGTQNAPEFLAYAKKLTSILDEFLDLLSDVPDEI